MGRAKVFINFSNHPINGWSEGQRNAAMKYGTLEEVPFPRISPQMNERELKSLSDKCFSKIKEMISGKEATVHIMGEMTLTFSLVERLRSIGVRCVASTTERNTIEYPDGRKESVFQFVRFREYQ